MQIVPTERTKLFVDGVAAAITADVMRRQADGMIVTQALPFLRLDTPVTGDDGQRTRISRVAIAMDGDVPKLWLELSNLEGKVSIVAPDVPTVREDTQESFTPGVSTKRARTDGTVPYEFQIREPSGEVIVGAATADHPATRRMGSLAIDLPRPSWPIRLFRRVWALFFGASPAIAG